MQVISSIEKLRLLKEAVYDLRNADLKQLENITEIIRIAKGEKAGTKITMSTRDMFKLLLNTHKQLWLDVQNNNYLIDQETLCKLVLEIDDFKSDVVDLAWEQIVAKAEDEVNKDMTAEQRIDALRCKILKLEEEVHTLKLKKTVILPTDDLYRTKEEYDGLRNWLNMSYEERKKLHNDFLNMQKISDEQCLEISRLKKELEHTKEKLMYVCKNKKLRT